jgi:hypothetical protein
MMMNGTKEWATFFAFLAGAVALTFWLTGCWKTPYTFMLKNGTVVKCRLVLESNCGVYLGKCDDGSEYWCVQDLEEWHTEKAVDPLMDRRAKPI